MMSTEKGLSIFEDHTDVIRKDRREIIYGHKICLTDGASSLILDCRVLEGNPQTPPLPWMPSSGRKTSSVSLLDRSL